METRETFFNELSLKQTLSRDVLDNIKSARVALRSKDITVCRVSHEIVGQLKEGLLSIPGVPKGTITNFFYSFFHAPYEKPDAPDEKETEFLSHNYSYDGENAIGLGWADTYQTLSFSLLTADRWNVPVLQVTKDGSIVDVHNVCTATHVETASDWLMQFEKPEDCRIPPQDKHFHVKDDHGKDELRAFWNKISKCPYVKECINSIPFNSSERDFIRRVYPDGRIEIVLTWEDKGYGMVIQTTGKGEYQTKKIADMLKRQYQYP